MLFRLHFIEKHITEKSQKMFKKFKSWKVASLVWFCRTICLFVLFVYSD